MGSNKRTPVAQTGTSGDPERESMLNINAPKDNYNLVYLLVLLNGIGVLMPWNMFITIAPAYYVDYKFTDVDQDGKRHATTFSLNFLNYLGVCSQVPNLLLNIINIFVQVRGSLVRRICYSLIIVATICLITLVFTRIDTTHMLTTFFYITMLLVIILNAANGIYQNSLYGFVAPLPPKYTNAVVLGNNVCGLFVSVISIITLLASNDVAMAAFLYFLVSLITIVACFASFFILPKLQFYTYHSSKKVDDEEVDQQPSVGRWNLYLEVFKKIYMQCFNVFLVYFVTLTIFPAVEAAIEVSRKDGVYNFIIPEKMFTPVTTFLLFSVCASLGSFIANYFQWPSPKWVTIPVVARLAFIPLMMFCNYRPDLRTWPVLIYNEWIYITLAAIMGLTNGYYGSVSMMYAPKLVDSSKSSTAGMIAAFFLVFGICAGVVFSLFVSWFIENAGPNKPLSA